jgi:hypothetical protein
VCARPVRYAAGDHEEITMTELLFLQWRHLSRAERICVGVLAAVLIAWVLMPAIAQDPLYHAFADQRTWLGIPHAADVLSNLALLAVGTFGIATLASTRRERSTRATEAGLWCVAVGFVGTAIGSAWYHLEPDDTALAWDRLPMTVIFTGILGTAIAQRVGENVARAALAVIFELGVASIVCWRLTGDLSLYLTLQYGGIAALLLLLLVTKRRDDPFSWPWLLAWYALAKLAEVGDRAVWDATGGIVGGHMLKHVFAAIGGLALFRPLRQSLGALAAPAAPRP